MFLSVMLSAVLVSFMGCTKDNLADGTQGAEDASTDHFYLDVAMSRPTDTRSQTDEDGIGNGKTNSDEDPDYEYGYDYENAVSEVLLVFADTNNKFIFAATANNILESPEQKPTTEFQFTAKASVKKSTITDEYAQGGMLAENKTVLIYAFCNPTSDLAGKFEDQSALKGQTTWLDFTGTLTEGATGGVGSNSIWDSGKFLMSNAKIKKADFPTSAEGWDPYSNPDNPFHLSKANEGSIDNSQSTSKLEYGPIYVERTACRFDFRDASQDLDDAHDDAFTYKLYGTGSVYNEGSTPTEKPNLLNVKLTRMSLVNMSKEYYYLRRVADSYAGMTDPGVVVGGTEIRTNYVVDTDWAAKNSHYSLDSYSAYSAAFNFPLFAENGDYNMTGWYGDALEDVVKGPNDTWTGTPNGGTYHIWRYATENTIADAEDQIHIQSVGLVFKGKIELGADKDAVSNVVKEVPGNSEGEPEQQGPTITNEAGYPYISDAVKTALESTTQNSPILYSFGGLLYAGFDGIAYTAVKNGYGSIAESLLSKWYLVAGSETPTSGTFTYAATAPTAEPGQYVFQLTPAIYELIKHKPSGYSAPEGTIDWSNGFSVTIADNLESETWFKEFLTKKGVTIYEPTQDGNTWGYYCYYFYWNYHNNNGKPSEMGPMEFATVRNNVYKLAVKTIGRLGHPGDPKDDPDPIDPDDPDESDDLYFDVEIQVLPWVVRVNDIEF